MTEEKAEKEKAEQKMAKRKAMKNLISKVNPLSWWSPKTWKIVLTTIAGYLIFRFLIYPHSDTVLTAIGLKPKDFISAEVYGGIIQSIVTGLTIYATFRIYEKSKRDTLSQKVYDKKFETYSLLWEKMYEIDTKIEDQYIEFMRNDIDTKDLKKEIADFEDEYNSKSLILSKNVSDLIKLWSAYCNMQLHYLDEYITVEEGGFNDFLNGLIQIGLLEEDEAEKESYKQEKKEYLFRYLRYSEMRKRLLNTIVELMKKELGLEKLELEINLSVDYKVTDGKELLSNVKLKEEDIKELEGIIDGLSEGLEQLRKERVLVKRIQQKKSNLNDEQ